MKPDVVSILIGVNDCLRRFDANEMTAVETYRENFRSILTQVKEIGSEIVIIEPFLLPITEEKKTLLRMDLDPKIHVARRTCKRV